ncbi:MAG: hypothetical protein DESF_01177 [Desulfovibrio sp.]
MLKPRNLGIGHCAGRQSIPCAKGQQKLIKSSVQGDYPPGWLLQAYLMAGIVADNYGCGGILGRRGWRGAVFCVRTGGGFSVRKRGLNRISGKGRSRNQVRGQGRKQQKRQHRCKSPQGRCEGRRRGPEEPVAAPSADAATRRQGYRKEH